MALFSANIAHANNLVEFGAGKMHMRGKMVQPDARKGTIFVYQSDDGLMHFCWKDAKSGTVEDDLIIFPDDAEFKPVKQCTTGRVYLLSFKNQSRKMFFWMQAFLSDRDEEYCKKVNDLLNNPPAPGSTGRPRTGGPGGHENLSDQFSMVNQLLNMGGGGVSGEDLQSALAGVDRRQMMQLINLMGAGSGGALAESLGGGADHVSPRLFTQPATQRPAATAAAGGTSRTVTSAGSSAAGLPLTSGPSGTDSTASKAAAPGATSQQPPVITAADFSKILSNLGMTTGGAASRPEVDLENVLVSKNVEPVLLGNEENMDRLVPLLPSENPVVADREEVLKTLQTPQFRQAVEVFGEALKSGQLGPFMQQFGFSSDVITAFGKGDVQSVAEMLEKETASEASGGGSSSKTAAEEGKKGSEEEKAKSKKDPKEKKEDDPMDLD